jgi:hypothetical protein
MGSLWEKWYLGTAMHATRGEMGRLIAKLLSNPLMFPKDTFGNVMKDTVSNGEGDGYAALHNIMRSVHPNVIEKAVNNITPYQGNMVTLAAYVQNMSNHLEKEALHKIYYTKYEGITPYQGNMVTLEAYV